MIKKLLLIIPILLLCGCNAKQCVKSHIETQVRWYPNGKGGLRMVVMPVSVCDEWEEVNNGRKVITNN